MRHAMILAVLLLGAMGCEGAKVNAREVLNAPPHSSLSFDGEGNTMVSTPGGAAKTYTNVDAEGNAENFGGDTPLRQVVMRIPGPDGGQPTLLTISAPDDLTLGELQYNVVENTITVKDLGALTSAVVLAVNERIDATVEATVQNAITTGLIVETQADAFESVLRSAIEAATSFAPGVP